MAESLVQAVAYLLDLDAALQPEPMGQIHLAVDRIDSHPNRRDPLQPTAVVAQVLPVDPSGPEEQGARLGPTDASPAMGAVQADGCIQRISHRVAANGAEITLVDSRPDQLP